MNGRSTHSFESTNNLNENQLHNWSTKNILMKMNYEDKSVSESVNEALLQIEKTIDIIVKQIENGGRVIYFGAGTSGRLGVLDASECPPTFGVSPELIQGHIAGGDTALRDAVEDAEDNMEEGKSDVRNTVQSPNDVVVGIASSGTTPYVLGAVRQANEMDLVTAGISCAVETPLSANVDYPIEVDTGEEVIKGSTRLKAGTAQKMVLNMISTTTMIKTGQVYNDLMINVRATNQKLRDRSVQMIMDIAGVDHDTAAREFKESNNDLKVAIIKLINEVSEEQARNLLLKYNNNFAKAIRRTI